jgi:hypothetical protein
MIQPILTSPGIALLIVVLPAVSLAGDARTEHTTTTLSTVASDSTSYFSGDAEAFNVAIAKLASECAAPPATIGKKAAPNITVTLFKGTGKAHLMRAMTWKSDGKESLICHVPPVPPEMLSGQMPAFDFDWIVLKSATGTERQVSVALFTGGNVDLFDCVMPRNVELKLGKPLTVTVTPDVAAESQGGR